MESVSIERNASAIQWCPVTDLSSISTNNNEYNPIYLLASAHQETDKHFNSTSQIEILTTSPNAYKINRRTQKKTIPSLGNCITKKIFTELAWGQVSKKVTFNIILYPHHIIISN